MLSIKSLSLFLLLFVLHGCGGGGSGGGDDVPESTTVDYNINGFVQKGPFINGTTITIQELKSDLTQTGLSFSTTITDDIGTFSVPVSLTSSYVEVIASGFYFDEVNATLSSSQLTLRAIADLSIDQSINVNVLTHLIRSRLIQLVTNGSAFDVAKTQAESEVLNVFGIVESNSLEFEDMTLTESGNSNAILLAASSLMQLIATMETDSSTTITAELSQILSIISTDISLDGTLEHAGIISSIKTASDRLQTQNIINNLQVRYNNLGVSGVNVPEFSSYIYTDKVWFERMGDVSENFEARSIAVDQSNDVYVIGVTYGPLNDFTFNSFIAKYNTHGAQQWIEYLSSTDQTSAVRSAIDSSGNVVAVGLTEGDLDGNGSSGFYDAFVVKYNSDGVMQSVNQFGTTEYDNATDIAFDSIGNYYVTGLTRGAIDGNTYNGGNDVFVLKFNSSDVKQWSVQIGTTSNDQVSGIAIDADGYIYLGGFTEGNFDGIENAGQTDVFLLKIDQNGATQWIRQMGTAGREEVYGLDVDSTGNAYLVGFTDGDLGGNGNAGGWDAFVLKYNNLGAEQWVRQFGTSKNDTAWDVVVDSNSIVNVVGETEGNLAVYDPLGVTDSFLAKYSISGTQQSLIQFGYTERDRPTAVIVDANNNILAAGITRIDLSSTIPGGGGNAAAYVAKFLP